jgi:hypothetical protein
MNLKIVVAELARRFKNANQGWQLQIRADESAPYVKIY